MKIIRCAGISVSHQSHGIYDAIEKQNTKYIEWARVIGTIGLCAPFVLSGLTPICYALFGFPSKGSWELPIPIKMLYRTDKYATFYIGMVEHFIYGLNYLVWVVIFVLFYIGICSYADALSLDLKQFLCDLNAELAEFKRASMLTDIVELHNQLFR